MPAVTDVRRNGWVKCVDHVWRKPDDWPDGQLPVPTLDSQALTDDDHDISHIHDDGIDDPSNEGRDDRHE